MIVVNDWLSVRDVLQGGKSVGQLRVTMAVGLGTQIYRLMLMTESSIKSPTLITNKNAKTKPQLELSLDDNESDVTTPPFKIDANEALNDVFDDKNSQHDSKWLNFNVKLCEARNLPLIKTKGKKLPPETYVTVSNGLRLFKSRIVAKSCMPRWNFDEKIALPEQLLLDSKRQLIIKVWHKDEATTDYVVGFAAVDLGILLRDSFTEIVGW